MNGRFAANSLIIHLYYVYIYIHIYICMCVYIYIYITRQKKTLFRTQKVVFTVFHAHFGLDFGSFFWGGIYIYIPNK